MGFAHRHAGSHSIDTMRSTDLDHVHGATGLDTEATDIVVTYIIDIDHGVVEDTGATRMVDLNVLDVIEMLHLSLKVIDMICVVLLAAATGLDRRHLE